MAGFQIRCGTLWGGVSNVDLDVFTAGVGASVCSMSSAGDKGGDIYYFSVCGKDQLTRIALADLQGHGEQVSHLSEWLYDALEKRINTLDGSGVLEQLNTMVYQHGFHAITTAAVIGYYLADSNLYFCYAGHPPVFLQRGAGSPWQVLSMASTGRSNLPLGVLPDARYEQAQTRLQPGDRLFLYTDGVLDCPNAEEEPFGQQRLLGILNGARNKSLSAIKKRLLASLRRHSDRPQPHDDITVMLVEAGPSRAATPPRREPQASESV